MLKPQEVLFSLEETIVGDDGESSSLLNTCALSVLHPWR